MNGNATDQGMIIAGSPAIDTSMTSGVALVMLRRDADLDRIYVTDVYRRSPALPPAIEVVIRNDLSIDGRASGQPGCSAAHADFVATAQSVELWQAAFSDPDTMARAIAGAMAQTEDAVPERLSGSAIRTEPERRASGQLEPPTATPGTPAGREAPYTLRDAIEDAHKISEIGKNVMEIWRGIRGDGR